MSDAWGADALLARLDAVQARLERLADAPMPDAMTDPDPESDERWEPAQVWAHMSELTAYWLSQARHVRDAAGEDPVPYGRMPTDRIRSDAIEERRRWTQDRRWAALRRDLDDVRAFARELTPDGWRARGLHPSGVVRDVGWILDRGIAAHLEEHAAQLESVAGSR